VRTFPRGGSRLPDPVATRGLLVSHDRVSRLEARLDRIERAISKVIRLLTEEPMDESDFPDANLGNR